MFVYNLEQIYIKPVRFKYIYLKFLCFRLRCSVWSLIPPLLDPSHTHIESGFNPTLSNQTFRNIINPTYLLQLFLINPTYPLQLFFIKKTNPLIPSIINLTYPLPQCINQIIIINHILNATT